MAPILQKISEDVQCVIAIIKLLQSSQPLQSMFHQQLSIGEDKKPVMMPLCKEITDTFITSEFEQGAQRLLSILKAEFDIIHFRNRFDNLFRLIYNQVCIELSTSSMECQFIWRKFLMSGTLTCMDCEKLRIGRTEGIFKFSAEGNQKARVSTLLNKMQLRKMGSSFLCYTCQDKGMEPRLPEFLIIQIEGLKPDFKPERKMKLVNEDTYILKRIITDNATTIEEGCNTWTRIQGVSNVFLFYEMLQVLENTECTFPGCPLDVYLKSVNDLRLHNQKEHPTCPSCNRTFITELLYKEHYRYTNCIVQNRCFMGISQIKSQGSGILNKGCLNHGCKGDHWCGYPPVVEFGNQSQTNGLILIWQSIVNGVPKFVPFNNSFLDDFGIQFYFKYTRAGLNIFSYSTKLENVLTYKLFLTKRSGEKIALVQAKVGDWEHSVNFNNEEDGLIYYELVLIHDK